MKGVTAAVNKEGTASVNREGTAAVKKELQKMLTTEDAASCCNTIVAHMHAYAWHTRFCETNFLL